MVASPKISFVSSVRDIGLDLAAQIRDARRGAHLSQVELAEQLGVSQRTLQAWEAGTVPQPRHRRAVLAFIGEQEAKAA